MAIKDPNSVIIINLDSAHKLRYVEHKAGDINGLHVNILQTNNQNFFQTFRI